MTSKQQDEMKQEIAARPFLVTVCICTFRRTSLVTALRSVINQAVSKETTYHVIVVDNDFDRSAEPLVCSLRAATGKNIEYLHAPGQNISLARNAALNACQTRWLAFLDDDETAASDWLNQLMVQCDGSAAIFGPCKAIYSESTPRWIRLGDYHSNRIKYRHGIIETGYTSNVLIDMDFVRAHNLRFDKSLGRTGGEDTIFFHAIYRSGGRLAYADDAIVYEEVSPTRTIPTGS